MTFNSEKLIYKSKYTVLNLYYSIHFKDFDLFINFIIYMVLYFNLFIISFNIKKLHFNLSILNDLLWYFLKFLKLLVYLSII